MGLRERLGRRKRAADELRELRRGAFAGDGIEKALIETAGSSLGLGRFVETGTYTGKTTAWLATTFPGASVLTCELMPELYEAARERLRSFTNVRCFLGDSAAWIREICRERDDGVPTFFFLDAHGMSEDWEAEHPLRDELRAILAMSTPSVIVIDDFKVPGRADLAFMVGGSGTSFAVPEPERLTLPDALCLETIADLLGPDEHVLFPGYTHADALRYQPDPLYGNLIGYVVILHALSAEARERFLGTELVRRHYITAAES